MQSLPQNHEKGLRLESGDRGVATVALSNALIICNTILRSCSALILMPVMIAWLGPQHYGLWITVTTVTMYVSLSESGLGQTVVNLVGRFYSLNRLDRVAQVATTAFVLYWMVVLPIGALAVGLVFWLPLGDLLLAPEDAAYEGLLKPCLAVSIALTLCRVPLLVFPGVLIGVRKMPTRLAWEAAGAIASLAATIVGLWLGLGLFGAVVVAHSTLLLVNAAIGVSCWRCGKWATVRSSGFRPKLLRPLFANSSYFFAINASGVVDRSATILLAPRMASLLLTPPFFLVTSVLRVATYSLVVAMPRAVHPYVAMWQVAGDWRRLATVAQVLTKVTTGLATLAVLVFVPYADGFLRVCLGPESALGGCVVWFVAAALLLDAQACAPTQFMIAMNRHRRLSALLIGKAMTSVVLSLALGATFLDPLEGIAAGSFCASILAFVILPRLFRPHLGVDWSDYSPEFVWRPLAFSTFVSAAAAACCLAPLEARPFAVAAVGAIAGWAFWALVLDETERDMSRAIVLRRMFQRLRKHRPLEQTAKVAVPASDREPPGASSLLADATATGTQAPLAEPYSLPSARSA